MVNLLFFNALFSPIYRWKKTNKKKNPMNGLVAAGGMIECELQTERMRV